MKGERMVHLRVEFSAPPELPEYSVFQEKPTNTLCGKLVALTLCGKSVALRNTVPVSESLVTKHVVCDECRAQHDIASVFE